LIGGIDLDALRHGKEAIQREIETKVPSLIEDGGFVPLADGRVREDVPFDNYVYYRKLLGKITQGGTEKMNIESASGGSNTQF
jgi:uroporphyrinogen decarboxylase